MLLEKKILVIIFLQTTQRQKNIPSTEILTEVLNIIEYQNLKLINLDITIVTQKFNVQEKADKIQENLSNLLNISKDLLNIKGKSSDDYGLIGDEKASLAIVSLLIEDA